MHEASEVTRSTSGHLSTWALRPWVTRREPVTDTGSQAPLTGGPVLSQPPQPRTHAPHAGGAAGKWALWWGDGCSRSPRIDMRIPRSYKNEIYFSLICCFKPLKRWVSVLERGECSGREAPRMSHCCRESISLTYFHSEDPQSGRRPSADVPREDSGPRPAPPLPSHCPWVPGYTGSRSKFAATAAFRTNDRNVQIPFQCKLSKRHLCRSRQGGRRIDREWRAWAPAKLGSCLTRLILPRSAGLVIKM